MEIHLIDSSVPEYRDLARVTKKTQISMESVVPDTREDIGRILSVCPDLCMKSKEMSGRGAAVAGEIALTLLYITEGGEGVSAIKITQPFTIDFDCPISDDETAMQLRWQISSVQTRAVNPRKVSADVELQAELSISRRDKLPVSQSLPEGTSVPVHLLSEEKTAARLLSVCERSFSVNEQLPFPDEAPQPREIVAGETFFRIDEKEIVGSRLLIKGRVFCLLVYMPLDSDIPAVQSFSVPFSQLIELGEAEAGETEVWIEKTSSYLETIETIEGKKLLNLELHALAQVRALQRQSLRFVADAYSNAMPCECIREELDLTTSVTESCIELKAQEDIDLPEEFEELLGIFTSIGLLSQEQCVVTADLLCRSREGKLFSMKRNLSIAAEEGSWPGEAQRVLITDRKHSLDGKRLTLAITVFVMGREETRDSLLRVVGLDLDEEKLFDTSASPSLTAVWPRNETLWELAKFYRSSPEAILEINGEDARPVFIPKTK